MGDYLIAIDRNFRGMGFANGLLEGSIREMRLNRIVSVLLYVNVNDTPAIKSYEKQGFRVIKETKNVCGQNERCYEMELNLRVDTDPREFSYMGQAKKKLPNPLLLPHS